MKIRKNLVAVTIIITSLIGVLFVSSPSFASLLGASKIKFGGYYRVRQVYYHNIELKKSENTSYFVQRFRLEPQLNINENIIVKFQIDMLDNVMWGDNMTPQNSIWTGNPSNNSAYSGAVTTPDGTGLLNINVKRVWLEYHSPVGNLTIGRAPFGFGLGVNYNNGDGFKNEWGDAYYGNTADLIQFATMPMGRDKPLVTVLQYAKMKGNNINNPYDDEDWYLFIPGYKTEKLTAFLLLLHMEQNQFKKRVNYAELYVDAKPIKNLKLLADYFYMSGSVMPFTPSSSAGGALKGMIGTNTLKIVGAQGGVLRGIYTQKPFDYELEIGFSPANGSVPSQIQTYPFSNDYNSSLILFNNQGLAAPNSTFYNPTMAGLSSLDPTIPGGSVLKDDFIYVAPMIKFIPADFLKTKLQLLWAETNDSTNYSPQSLSNLVTGQLITANGNNVKLARDLGYEIDYGVDITLSDNFIFGFQTGYFIPGAVFKNASGKADSVFAFETRFTVLL